HLGELARRHLATGVEAVRKRVEGRPELVPAAQPSLGNSDGDRHLAPLPARPAQHHAAAEVGRRLAEQAGMMMDTGELARREADVELMLAGVVLARSRHAEIRWRMRAFARFPGRQAGTVPASAGDGVFASKNPACSRTVPFIEKRARGESFRAWVDWS